MNVVLKIKKNAITLFFFIGATVVFSQISTFKTRSVPPLPTGIFSPSNSKTESNNYIPAADFIKASRCAECHLESHAEWSESLHRNSGREPFYKASVEILEKERGTEFAQHCESCHRICPTLRIVPQSDFDVFGCFNNRQQRIKGDG
jgi:hypothetical protein